MDIKDTEEYKSTMELLDEISIKKEFVPFELAFRMKSLGLDVQCFNLYHKDTHQLMYKPTDSVIMIKIDNHNKTNHCSAPTFSQAFRWFRDNYQIESKPIVVVWNENKFYNISTFVPKEYNPDQYIYDYKKHLTYEEAEIACVQKLIEIVEHKLKNNE